MTIIELRNEFRKYADSDEFDMEQLDQILMGLENGIDVSIYAKPEFNS